MQSIGDMQSYAVAVEVQYEFRFCTRELAECVPCIFLTVPDIHQTGLGSARSHRA